MKHEKTNTSLVKTSICTYLNKAVMEMDTEKTSGKANVVCEHFLKVITDNSFDARTTRLVVSPREARNHGRELSRGGGGGEEECGEKRCVCE